MLKVNKLTSNMWLTIYGILLSVLIRLCVMLDKHSGENQPPMYGDYEAQRHWMEITVNLPINEWYKNTSKNNLSYWGLDYPPLTAYHMYLCGQFSKLINNNYTKLFESYGYQSMEHKLFMRLTVLFGDFLLFLPAVITYFINVNKHNNQNFIGLYDKPLSRSASIILSLFYPGIILIDHGHFQYNSISLGLFIMSVICLLYKKLLLTTILFCLALNYKQMELYHSLPFFIYFLSKYVDNLRVFLKLSLTVVLTFLLIWFPFLLNVNDLLNVFERQFPIKRGIYEDKVSNFWCVVNLFYKLKLNIASEKLFQLSFLLTILSSMPSVINLFLYPNIQKFLLSQINISLSFFLFSYQVHEKSILLVAIPVILNLSNNQKISVVLSFWFLFLTVFSMFPLLIIKDQLIISTVALIILYFSIFYIIINNYYLYNSSDILKSIKTNFKLFNTIISKICSNYSIKNNENLLKLIMKELFEKKRNRNFVKKFLLYFPIFLSLLGCTILTILLLLIEPPKLYPDLFSLLISVYSAIHFVGFFIYFNYKQICVPFIH